ncbi:MAG: hypothetical protein E4G96_04440 [Chrysiogenales bacterium]|nr:MAG: hypothetical protein E4G96_04440 [Chrysiogenales bacterium]
MGIEGDFNLYKLIIQSVETQIRENDPPATKMTYERLISAGHDEAAAKEKIASLIAEEIYLSMKDNRKISEKEFSARLSELE